MLDHDEKNLDFYAYSNMIGTDKQNPTSRSLSSHAGKTYLATYLAG